MAQTIGIINMSSCHKQHAISPSRRALRSSTVSSSRHRLPSGSRVNIPTQAQTFGPSCGSSRLAKLAWRNQNGDPMRRQTKVRVSSPPSAPPSTSSPEWPEVSPPKKDTPSKIDINLPEVDPSLGTIEKPLDILIVGAGPAGLGAADKASAKGLSVAIVDPNLLSLWPNNYGVWVDEFEALGFSDCFIRKWDRARVVFDAGEDESIQLGRPYGQVDRIKLKEKLIQRCIDRDVQFYNTGVSDVDHGSTKRASSEVMLFGDKKLHARAVLDATGHSRRLVEFDKTFTPGYQAAYGIMIEVESHPFPIDEMLFMDWRSNHLDPELEAKNDKLPTFLYAMPFSPTRVFVEETSLVARPEVSFDDLKARLKQRLEFLGITVKAIEEEEYCLIPMGGVLPTFPQRTLGIGGTAGMVHPSTGFMVAKTLRSAETLVNALDEALENELKGMELSESIWMKVWPSADLRLRTFMCFGMETLMALDVKRTRLFFNTFFRLPKDIWGGFLSWQVTYLKLAKMAALLFKDFPATMKVDFVLASLPFIPSYIKNFVRSNANRFSSKPWAGLTSQSKVMKAELESINAKAGMLEIPLPLKNYEREAFETAKENYEKLLNLDLDTPLPASQLYNDRKWTVYQQMKQFDDQPTLGSVLAPLGPGEKMDVIVVGGGPAGIGLAGELAAEGLSVALISPDTPFTNNYGVWLDEFEDLGLEECIVGNYEDVLLWTQLTDKAGGRDLGRRYGRVGRKELRAVLLDKCLKGGVKYYDALVESVENDPAPEGLTSTITCKDGFVATASLSVLTTGHNRDVNQYQDDAPPYGWQTAYGIEVTIPNHPFPTDRAVFMDFRQSDPEVTDPESDSWRVPSFLYVLPDGPDTVFLEETCLCSSVQVPFDELKRRLYRRLALMGIAEVSEVNIIEEEASWIPLGGPLPQTDSYSLAFGAAAGLVHPASGYSIVNSLRRAKPLAKAVAQGLKTGGGLEASQLGWEVLWSGERMRQTAFHQFGMELLVDLQLKDLQAFFTTFYELDPSLSQRFLSHDLNSAELIYFAYAFFIRADNRLRYLLVKYLSLEPGNRFLQVYKNTLLPESEEGESQPATELLNFKVKENATTISLRDQKENEDAGYLSGFQQIKDV